MQKLIDQIDTVFTEFKVEAQKREQGNKAAGVRARTISLALRGLLKTWKAESVKK